MARAQKINIPLMDPKAIETNQNGWLTDEQRGQVTRALEDDLIAGDFVCLCMLVPIFLALLPGFIVNFSALAPSHLFIWPDAVFPILFYGLLFTCLFNVGQMFLPYMLARRELVEPTITTVEGRVVYNQSRGRYQANIPGHKLRLIDGTKEVPLPPGFYRFSYLPVARRILSAEWLRPSEPGGPCTEMLRALMYAHGFTAEDLALNQEGLLSPGQQEKLFGNVQDPQSAPPIHVDMMEARVERYSGSTDDGNYFIYVWWHKREVFRLDVTRQACCALIPGMFYRVYYLIAPLRLVSIEPTSTGFPFLGSSKAKASLADKERI